MRRSHSSLHRLALAALLAAAGGALHAADDLEARRDAIEQQYNTDRRACDGLAGNAKDVCAEQAEGKRKVARAQLDATRDPSPKRQQQLAEARADATYAVAKERCDDLAGNAKDVCVKDAKAAHTRAVADAKAARSSAGARAEANEEKAEAGYEAEAERCDALSGEAKDACVNAAKARHGKR